MHVATDDAQTPFLV